MTPSFNSFNSYCFLNRVATFSLNIPNIFNDRLQFCSSRRNVLIPSRRTKKKQEISLFCSLLSRVGIALSIHLNRRPDRVFPKSLQNFAAFFFLFFYWTIGYSTDEKTKPFVLCFFFLLRRRFPDNAQPSQLVLFRYNFR